MGLESLRVLADLPIDAIEFAAGGGTNFAMLELLRSDEHMKNTYTQLANLGHTASDMVNMWNDITSGKSNVPDVIISGGVRDFLDGYYHISKCNTNAVYGQASSFLKHAMGDYEELQKYVSAQIQGLRLAHTLLTVRR